MSRSYKKYDIYRDVWGKEEKHFYKHIRRQKLKKDEYTTKLPMRMGAGLWFRDYVTVFGKYKKPTETTVKKFFGNSQYYNDDSIDEMIRDYYRWISK